MPHKWKAHAIYLQIKERGRLRRPQLDLSINVPALLISGAYSGSIFGTIFGVIFGTIFGTIFDLILGHQAGQDWFAWLPQAGPRGERPCK